MVDRNVTGKFVKPSTSVLLIDGTTGVPVTPGGGGTTGQPTDTYREFIVNSGVLTMLGLAILYHNFKKFPGGIEIRDPLGKIVRLDISEQTIDAIVIDFSPFQPITGDYKVTVTV